MEHPNAPWLAPDLAAFETMAQQALADIPEPFRAAARNVAIRVEDFADDTLLAAMDMADPFELTGLYEGIPLTDKSSFDQPDRPDVIWLFRRPILDEWADRGTVPLGDLIAHVLVHELAHHFGWSDDDIAAVDAWWI
ncbi:MAG: metallopeptidase family protein [Rhodobacter sp.]|nr:metallopeptidase family protein [Rhodobacter sp.]